MQSLIIVGGTAEERKEKTFKITNSQFQISNFDTILIEGETSIGIAQIRELEHTLSLKPYNSPFKAAIIHPGELLTSEAQNALLKILEEPNESSLLFLTAPQTESLLPTVVSRCQIIRLSSKPEIILSDEEFGSVFLLLSSVLRSGAGERLKIVSQIGKTKEDIKEWLIKMIFVCREILMEKENIKQLFFEQSEKFHRSSRTSSSNNNEANNSYKLVSVLTPIQIVQIIKNAEKTRVMLSQNINPRLALEIFLLDLPEVSIQSTPGVE